MDLCDLHNLAGARERVGRCGELRSIGGRRPPKGSECARLLRARRSAAATSSDLGLSVKAPSICSVSSSHDIQRLIRPPKPAAPAVYRSDCGRVTSACACSRSIAKDSAPRRPWTLPSAGQTTFLNVIIMMNQRGAVEKRSHLSILVRRAALPEKASVGGDAAAAPAYVTGYSTLLRSKRWKPNQEEIPKQPEAREQPP